jgi:hypothetical protein
MVTSDEDGTMCLFELQEKKFCTMPYIQDDNFLVKIVKIKISSEPIWRVMLFNPKDLIICGMPNVIKILKINRKNNKYKLKYVKVFTSSISSFGHSEILSINEVHLLQSQLESKFVYIIKALSLHKKIKLIILTYIQYNFS